MSARKIDVLFVHPGDRKQIYQSLGDEFCAIEPPVFAGLFATYMRRRGAEVAIYDVPAMFVSAEAAVSEMMAAYDPRLVVLCVYGSQPSASTQNMTSAGKIARLFKERAPACPVLMTGTHPAALPEHTMQEECVDFVCDGEGPVTIAGTLEALAGRGMLADVPGLWWRDDGAVVRPKAAAPLVRNLDEEMPGVAWDLLPMERYRAHNWHCFDHIDRRSPYAAIHTSLGCPYRCHFCCINAPFHKPSYRMWSPATVVAEIEVLVTRYGVRNIKFVDEMFVLNRAHVEGICDLLIERGLDVNIWAYARVDTVFEDLLPKMKRAGFNWLCLGIESASDYVRDGANKTFRNDDVIGVVRRIQAAGIRIIGNYIFGLPDDSMERMQQTLDLALELNCEFANFYSAMAYPGSALYAEAAAKGLPLPAQWHHYSQHSPDTMPLPNDHCTGEDILRFRDQAWNLYFNHPAYLNMVRDKFGEAVVEHIRLMTSIPLARRYHSTGESK